MTEIERVLVPVDFSRCSVRALELATRLGSRRSCRIDLLHVLEWRLPERLSGLEQEFSPLVGIISRELADRVHVRIRRGEAAEQIRAVASEGYDLIVMGMRGRGGRLVSGSVVRAVSATSSCPVVAVDENAKPASAGPALLGPGLAKGSSKLAMLKAALG